MTRRFAERTRRRGWVGRNSIAQPDVGDRLVAVVSKGTEVKFGHPTRVTLIGKEDTEVAYHLADGTIITAPVGAQIIWEAEES